MRQHQQELGSNSALSTSKLWFSLGSSSVKQGCCVRDGCEKSFTHKVIDTQWMLHTHFVPLRSLFPCDLRIVRDPIEPSLGKLQASCVFYVKVNEDH